MFTQGIRLSTADTPTANRTKEVYSKQTPIRGLEIKTDLEIYVERARFLRNKGKES
jgi:hypothetical protein